VRYRELFRAIITYTSRSKLCRDLPNSKSKTVVPVTPSFLYLLVCVLKRKLCLKPGTGEYHLNQSWIQRSSKFFKSKSLGTRRAARQFSQPVQKLAKREVAGQIRSQPQLIDKKPINPSISGRLRFAKSVPTGRGPACWYAVSTALKRPSKKKHEQSDIFSLVNAELGGEFLAR